MPINQAIVAKQLSEVAAYTKRTSTQRDSVSTDAVVSVCIVNWNCKELLRNCLSSLFENEQGIRFEVIVVDNGSMDGAADMVEAAFPMVRLVRNAANLGFSRANNQAAAISRGDYFFFLNNDTIVPEYTLIELVKYVDAHPNVGMIGPKLIAGDGSVQISFRRKPTLAALLHRVGLLRWTGLFRRSYYDYRRETFDPTGIKQVEALMGAAVLLPKKAFEKAGQWDESYEFGGEDLDISAQVGKNFDVVYHGDVSITHFGRVSSRANAGYVAGNVAVGYVRYFRKAGEPKIAIWLYKTLVSIDAPIQCLAKYIQGLGRKIINRPHDAEKSFESAKCFAYFLRHDLFRFWRA